MDPFTEKEILELLKSISASLKGIHEELEEINASVKEAAEQGYAYEEDDEELDDGDLEEEEDAGDNF